MRLLRAPNLRPGDAHTVELRRARRELFPFGFSAPDECCFQDLGVPLFGHSREAQAFGEVITVVGSLEWHAADQFEDGGTGLNRQTSRD